MMEHKPKCSNKSLDSKVEDFRCFAKLHANVVTCILIQKDKSLFRMHKISSAFVTEACTKHRSKCTCLHACAQAYRNHVSTCLDTFTILIGTQYNKQTESQVGFWASQNQWNHQQSPKGDLRLQGLAFPVNLPEHI